MCPYSWVDHTPQSHEFLSGALSVTGTSATTLTHGLEVASCTICNFAGQNKYSLVNQVITDAGMYKVMHIQEVVGMGSLLRSPFYVIQRQGIVPTTSSGQ